MIGKHSLLRTVSRFLAVATAAFLCLAAKAESPDPVKNTFLPPEFAQKLQPAPEKETGLELAPLSVSPTTRCFTRNNNEVPCTSPKAAKLVKGGERNPFRPATPSQAAVRTNPPTKLFFSIGEGR